MLPNITRARLYLAAMDPAISGNGGDYATFRAARALVKRFGLSEEQALPLLLEWNATRCQPPWSESELKQKLRSAQQSQQTASYLANSPPRPSADLISFRMPEMHYPTRDEILALSQLRSIPGSALHTAAAAGLLQCGCYGGVSCFFLTESGFAQARRLDGQPLPVRDGHSKAKNLPGSSGAFIGAGLLEDTPRVLLVEGCIGLLEALGCISLADVEGWTAIAATSASSRFTRAPGLLASLKGRHVRILPDSDNAGLDAATTWLHALEHAGCRVDALQLPPGCKDLGPIVADPLAHAETLHSLFQ